MSDVPKARHPKEGQRQGSFFAIDRRTFAKVCDIGLNAATAYLILARGTGRDNRTSPWSANAIEKYTSISRSRAKTAITSLVTDGFVSMVGTRSQPKYKLLDWAELAFDQSALSSLEQEAVDHVASGRPLADSKLKQSAIRAQRKGRLKSIGDYKFKVIAVDRTSNLVWLPNSLVTGAVGEIPPLERVRQASDVMTLRLLVDLYHSQNLREDGGISRSIIHQKWERFEVAEYGEFVVWGFTVECIAAPSRCEIVKVHLDCSAHTQSEGYAPFWKRLDCLEDCGLIQWVPCLFESSNEDAEIIHPLSIDSSCGPESRLGRAAYEAGMAMLTNVQSLRAVNERGAEWIIPVKRHINHVELIGVARLRYRPHTSLTSAWWAETNNVCEEHIAEYERLVSRAEGRANAAESA